MVTLDYIEVDASDFGRALQLYMQDSRRDGAEVLKQQCKLLVQDVVKFTPPNRGQYRRRAGEATVLADVAKTHFVAKTPRERVDYYRHHQSQRTKRGRVSKRAVAIPVTAAEANAVRRILLRRVGLLAAGWMGAAQDLGLSLPSWISRHGRRGGGAQRIVQGFSVFYRLNNDSVYSGDKSGATRRLRVAIDKRTRLLMKSVLNYLSKNKSRYGFQ